jgi:Zn-finger nucleic acid-binding protein
MEEPVRLTTSTHASGAPVLGCPSCGGHFVEYADMLRLESSGKGADRAAIARRAFADARGPVTCAKCGGATARREWSIGTLTYVDVCVDFDCRGVWLDEGELEAIAGK